MLTLLPVSAMAAETAAQADGEVSCTDIAAISAAISSAGTSPTTIKLTEDITMTLAVTQLTVSAGQNIVLDLNGKKIIAMNTSGTLSHLIENKGSLTIVDSTGGSAGNINAMMGITAVIANVGTLTVESGGVESTCGTGITSSGTLEIGSAAVVTGKGCALEVTGGSAKLSAKRMNATTNGSDSGNTIHVTGNSEVTITGGKYEAQGDSAAVILCEGESAKISISGGTFSSAVPEAYCAEGFLLRENSDGTFEVAAPAAAVFDGEGTQTGTYATLQAAVAALTGEAYDYTVKLLSGVTLEETLVLSKPITLDLNGNNLTGPAAGVIRVARDENDADSDPSVTIIDSTGGKASISNASGDTAGAVIAVDAGCGLFIGEADDDYDYESYIHGVTVVDTTGGAAISVAGEEVGEDENGAGGGVVYFDAGAVQSANGAAFRVTGTGAVMLDGGSVEAVNAVVFENPADGAAAYFQGVDVTATGETVKGITAVTTVLVNVGSTFNKNDLAAYCDSDYTLVWDAASGKYTAAEAEKVVKVLDASGGDLGQFADLQTAVDRIAKGLIENASTIQLMKDVTLADDTPVKLMDLGTEESPITLDLNGYTISGSNENTGLIATSKTPGGILWVSASHVVLTDSSDGTDRGGIVNTVSGVNGGFAVAGYSSAEKETALTIDGGVRIEIENAGASAAAVKMDGTASQQNVTVTVKNANVKASGYTFDLVKKTNVSGTIQGGTFATTAATAYSMNGNAQPIVTGGTFTGGNLGYNLLQRLGDGKNALYTENADGMVTAEVVDGVPSDYTAHVVDTTAYGRAYLKQGDLYVLQNWSMLKDKKLEVVKNATITFPEGKFLGVENGTPYAYAFDLAGGVTLSGDIPVALADVTVTGSSSLSGSFKPLAGYEMTANGENGLYSCRLGQDKTVAVLTKANGTQMYYADLSTAWKATASASNSGSTLKLYQDGTVSKRNVQYDLTVDLNGHTLTYTTTSSTNTYAFAVSGSLKIVDSSEAKGGKLEVSEAATAAITVKGGKLVIGEGVTVKGSTVLLDAANGVLDVYGTIDTRDTKNTAIQGNGSDGKGNTRITVHEGAKVLAKGTETMPVAAIYHPQSGELTIQGGEISGDTGIYIKSGSLTVQDGTITANGAEADYAYDGSGYNPTGDAIVLDACGYPGGVPSAEITGGTIKSASNQPVACYHYAGADGSNPDIADKGVISGGTYSPMPDAALLADGYAAKLVEDGSGNYIVELENPAHEHVWSTEWTSDGDAHWHACTAEGCDITENSQKDGYAAHTRDGGTVTKEPTTEETGTKVYKCTVCGYVMETETLDKLTPEHTHEWAGEWSMDETYHWHACTAGDGAKQDEGAHVYDGDADDTCNTCGYVRELEVEGETYTITANATNGTIDPDGETRVKTGGSLTVKFWPKDGFKAESVRVQVDGAEVDALDQYTFEDVTDNHIILVEYTEKTDEPVEPEEPTINLVGPNEPWPDAPCITLTDGAVTAVQAAGGIGEAFGVPVNTTLSYWTYKGWTFTAEKDGTTETFGTCKTLTQELADWLTEKISEGGWTLTMDSKTPGVYTPSGTGSSGGGGGSSSSTTKTETVNNSDGSTTTTVTDTKTGTVTETVKTADGVTGTTVTDKNGDVTKVTASVPADVAKDAAASGETVTLPVEVPAVKDTDDAPAVSVTVPKSAGAVKVEIPVEKVTSGTVAVIVKADGTEEIVKTSVPTEDGVALTVEGSATVKVIDNSKEFVDVHPVDHWAEESIDFVTSRELFNGKTADTFAPNDSTTRAQLMTVLARLDGADTTGAALEKGMAWAVEKGVSDGTNPSGTITRQQLAAMLYRYAGSPVTDYELTHSDAHRVSDYAVDAMRWAVANGIITGKADGTLDPHGLATRAQVATMMARYCAKMA